MTMLLDRCMPEFQFREAHSLEIEADASDVFKAIGAATLEEMPLARMALAVRALPALLRGRVGRLPAILGGRSSRRPLLEAILAGGSGFTLLAEAPGEEIVVGTIGQFWVLWGGSSVKVADAQEFRAVDRPGYAKAAMNFHLLSLGDARVRLSTETRVLALDPASGRKFARYWRVIRIGSGLIRRQWLAVVKRRAERPRSKSPR